MIGTLRSRAACSIRYRRYSQNGGIQYAFVQCSSTGEWPTDNRRQNKYVILAAALLRFLRFLDCSVSCYSHPFVGSFLPFPLSVLQYFYLSTCSRHGAVSCYRRMGPWAGGYSVLHQTRAHIVSDIAHLFSLGRKTADLLCPSGPQAPARSKPIFSLFTAFLNILLGMMHFSTFLRLWPIFTLPHTTNEDTVGHRKRLYHRPVPR